MCSPMLFLSDLPFHCLLFLYIVLRLTQASTREKSVVNEIFGGYLRSQGIKPHLYYSICATYSV